VPVSLPLEDSVPVVPVELRDGSEEPAELSVPLVSLDESEPVVPVLLNEDADELCELSAPVFEFILLSEPEPESVADDCELNNAVLVEDC